MRYHQLSIWAGIYLTAFTEHGVLMLANVLKSERAIKVSIRIIELFVKLRKFNISYEELRREMERIKEKVNN